MNFTAAEESIGYTFKDKTLLKRALTLASYDADDNNQVLEFFGDAILEFLVSEKIYDEDKSEGELTETRKLLVSDEALTPVSARLGLENYFLRSHGDTNLKKSIPSAYEAVLAAIYLDGGMDEARSFVRRTLDFSNVKKQRNFKGELQEVLQGMGEQLPVYVREDAGTPQKHVFISRVTVLGRTFEGRADSVKMADRLAAESALKWLQK